MQLGIQLRSFLLTLKLATAIRTEHKTEFLNLKIRLFL